jgi:hypothetical protein
MNMGRSADGGGAGVRPLKVLPVLVKQGLLDNKQDNLRPIQYVPLHPRSLARSLCVVLTKGQHSNSCACARAVGKIGRCAAV